MKRVRQMLVVAGVAAAFVSGGTSSQAQDNNGREYGYRQHRGNLDPAQWRQRRLDDLKERLEVKDDTEWKAIQPLIEKVTDAQQVVMRDRIGGMFGRGGRPGGDTNGGGDNNGRQRFRGFGGEPSPSAEALQKAIDGKASNSEMKTALAKFSEERKQKQAD